MRATDILMREHRIIESVLNVLDHIALTIGRGDAVDAALIRDAVVFVRDYADKWHHAKEEDVLFRAMGNHGFPTQAGPVAVMLAEHDMGRDLMARIVEALPGFEGGDAAAGAKIADAAASFSALLSQHIQKEDNILYRMAQQVLGEEDAALVAAYADVEAPHGAGSGKELEALATDLRARAGLPV